MTQTYRVGCGLLICLLVACAGTPQQAPPQAAATVAAEPMPVTTVEPEPVPAPAAPEPEAEPAPTPSPPPASAPPPSTPSPTETTRAPPRPPVARPPAAASPSPARPATPATPATPEPAATMTLRGRLELAAGTGQPVTPGEAADGVVYFLPQGGSARPRPGRFTINTHSRGFSPGVRVVPVGSTLSFPNNDTILHNVFSRTPGSTFDLGLYGPGETRNQVLSRPGLVIVNCNVHPQMRADVLVLETPHFVRPSRDGRFELAQLPPGPGTLVFWHPRARAQSVSITDPTAPVQRRLVADRAGPGAHGHHQP